ncbi:hypothetical protein J3R82DRAFT_2995 [Butyriboletus roseoflavus]|nr:hypothetical protein J3R82DRAFT_2995 [Butyriboletus roseoflavus]
MFSPVKSHQAEPSTQSCLMTSLSKIPCPGNVCNSGLRSIPQYCPNIIHVAHTNQSLQERAEQGSDANENGVSTEEPQRRLRQWTPLPTGPSIYAREDSNANGYDKEDQLAPPDDYQAEVQPWHPSLGVYPNQDSCSDPLLSLPEQPPELRNLIDRYMSLLARKKRLVEKRRMTISDQTTLRRLNVELTRLELYMCSMISRALNLSTVREATEERGWPTVVNFMALAKSAWTLEVVLGNLLLDPSWRKSHFIWMTFLARVASSFGPGRLDKFASASLQKLREYGFDPLVYTGYYGYKGQYVIHQTLMAMFGMVSRPEMIDIEPLSFLQFTEQFLIPFVAVHTISQELDVSLEDAFGILQQSTVTGKQLQPEPADDNPDIHAICSYNLD